MGIDIDGGDRVRFKTRYGTRTGKVLRVSAIDVDGGEPVYYVRIDPDGEDFTVTVHGPAAKIALTVLRIDPPASPK